MIGSALILARRISPEDLSEILDVNPLTLGSAIEAFDEKDLALR